jgi:hypothetical protein
MTLFSLCQRLKSVIFSQVLMCLVFSQRAIDLIDSMIQADPNDPPHRLPVNAKEL